MPRELTPQQLAAIAAKQVNACLFAQLDFSTVLRVSNLPFAYIWGGFTWAGLSDVGAVAPIFETTSDEVKGVALTLSGVPNELIATSLAEDYQGKRCQIWFAFMDDANALIGTPVRVYFGRIDTMSIESGSEQSAITVTVEPPTVDWQRPRAGRFNNEDQQARFPGDRGLEHVADMVEIDILWGRS